MTSPEPEYEEEFWEDVELGSALQEKLRLLGDRACELHTFLHGPGGDWNGKPDFYFCGFGSAPSIS